MDVMEIRRRIIEAMASGERVYTGTFTIDANHALFDMDVNFEKDPIFILVEPNFTPTYGVNSLISYMLSKSDNVLTSTNGSTDESNHWFIATVEGRTNYPQCGYPMTNTYTNMIDNIVMTKQRVYLPTRNSSYTWQSGEYKWYAF